MVKGGASSSGSSPSVSVSASELMTKGGGVAEGVDDLVDKSKGTLSSGWSSCSVISIVSKVTSDLMRTSGGIPWGLATGLGCFWDPVEQLAGGVGGSRCLVLKAGGKDMFLADAFPVADAAPGVAPSRRSRALVF